MEADRVEHQRDPEDRDLERASQQLVELTDHVRDAERCIARAVLLAADVAASGVCEVVEGMPLELWLANACRLIGADRHTLITASENLQHMPVLANLFAGGQVSWGQVRNICRSARRLNGEQRRALDRRIHETVTRHGGLDAFNPDQLLWAADRAVDELTRPDIRRRERDRARRSFMAIQGRLDGGSRFWGEADPQATAILTRALDVARAHPEASTDERDGTGDRAGSPVGADDAGHGRDGARDEGTAPPEGDGADVGTVDPDGPEDHAGVAYRRRARIQALVGICSQWLAGGPDRRARPLLNVIVDIKDLPEGTGGLLDNGLNATLPTISARLGEILATDGDMRAVLVDGRRPLAVSRKRHAAAIPGEVRIAVAALDRGDRFPGSDLPLSATQMHHVRPRAKNGDHDPDNIIALGASRHDPVIHRRGWLQHLDPRTRMYTITRNGRTFRSLPHATPLEPDPDPPRTVVTPTRAIRSPRDGDDRDRSLHFLREVGSDPPRGDDRLPF